jgi:type I restriction enzyme M protein
MRTGAAKYGAVRELLDTAGAGRILFLRAKNISPTGKFRISEEEDDVAYIDLAGIMSKPAAEVQPGEIVFVRVGAGCYGRTALIPQGFVAQADDWIHVLTPEARVDASGLVDWMNSTEGRARVRLMAKGVGTPSISKTALAELQIPARFVR